MTHADEHKFTIAETYIFDILNSWVPGQLIHASTDSKPPQEKTQSTNSTQVA